VIGPASLTLVCTLGGVPTARPSEAAKTLAPFSSAVAQRVLEAACRRAGLASSDAVLLRLGENAIYRLAHDTIVVRIARTMGYWDDARKEVEVARWLAANGIPAATTAGPDEQPIEAAGHPVTFWRFIDGRVSAHDEIDRLGGLLHQLHALPRPSEFHLPALDILGRVEERVHLAPIAPTDRRFLLDRLAELRAALDSVTWQLPPAVVHGDAHDHNVMIEDGRALLIDFERFAWGQPEWDLAVIATEYLTGGWWSGDEYAAFVNAYGFDVTDWGHFGVVRAVNELKMTTWIMQNVHESSDVADEFQARMTTLRTGRTDRPWRPF
jgi:Ser/Thr protein kinase RdoA (MazF antagonist)